MRALLSIVSLLLVLAIVLLLEKKQLPATAAQAPKQQAQQIEQQFKQQLDAALQKRAEPDDK